jgi:hypothetical protein
MWLIFRRIIETTRYIIKELETIDGIYVMGAPEVSVVAIGNIISYTIKLGYNEQLGTGHFVRYNRGS